MSGSLEFRMPLSAGTRLGPYEVVSPLGAGGMGEVYRVVDTRLGRPAAVKLLPQSLLEHRERIARFEREARAASALNHPNVVTIYETGSGEFGFYIAMELIEGKTLREILHAGSIPLRRLLSVASQIADGLAKAHAAGIVHRDLKPDNVMVAKDGLVKILDFGLAKLSQAGEDRDDDSRLATMTHATEPGVVLGTAGYMSPEQARGQSLDFRSDQFSFGSILYEMATGKRAFARDTAVQTLAAILQEEPEPVGSLNPKIPPVLRWTLERCLAKDPAERYAATADLARDLVTLRDHLSETTSAVGLLPARQTSARLRRRRLAAVAGMGILMAAAIILWRLVQRDYFWKNPFAGARYTRFTDWDGSETDAALSRDGKFVAFISDRSGPLDAWVGQVGGGAFVNLSKGKFPNPNVGTVRPVGFSGDGTHVWFQVPKVAVPDQLWLVPTIGGVPQLFLPKGEEAVWSPDGSQVAYFFPPGDPIFVADRNGANPRQILADKKGFHNHYLSWSPDGRFLYFVRGVALDDMDVWRVRTSGGEPERVTNHHERVAYPSFLDARTLIYCAAPESGGWGLYAMDTERRISHVVTSGLEEYTSIASSGDGRRLAATVSNPVRNLWTAPLSDHVVEEAGIARFDLPTVRASAPRYGPDYVVYLSSKGGAQGLWTWKDGADTELWSGNDGPVPFAPGVSTDGTQIAFVTRSHGHQHLSVMASDGTAVRRIAESLDVVDAPSWSPDGKWVAVVAREEEDRARPLYKVPVDGGPPVRLVEGLNSDPVWSPDGRLILYSEGRGGSVPLRAVTPDKRAVAMPDVAIPYAGNRYRFLPNGKAIVILLSRLTRAAPTSEYFLLDLESGRARQLTSLSPGFIMKSFDVSPDGKQILFDRYRENSDVVLIDLER